jgi:hypothetical protein
VDSSQDQPTSDTDVRQSRVNRKKALIIAGAMAMVVVPAVAFGIVRFVAAANVPSADQTAIQYVCLQAVVADETLAVRLGTPGVVVKPQSIETTDTSPVTDAERQAMKDHAAQVYAAYYTGDLLTQKVKIMDDEIDHYTMTDVRYFGGGVDWMTFSEVTINGSAATVSARAQIWAKKAQDQGNGKLVYVTPHSQIDYTFTLVKVNERWFIGEETWQFTPGSEP